MDIQGTDVRRILVNTRSSVNILYKEVFDWMELPRDWLRSVRTPLSGFTGDYVESEGVIELEVELGAHPNTFKTTMDFVVVNIQCVHNAILGRPRISKVGAIISMPHLYMKFYTPNGVGIVRRDQRSARQCYTRAVKGAIHGDAKINTIS